MDRSRGLVYATVAVLVVVTAATGPLGLFAVPAPADGSTANIGTGDATLSVVSTPERVRLVAGSLDSSPYYLRVPDSVLSVESVRGRPLLTYSLDIDGLGYSRSSVHTIEEPGRVAVSMERTALEPETVTDGSYAGRLQLVLRGTDTERTVHEQPVRVVVRE
jgi:hypothetical protein